MRPLGGALFGWVGDRFGRKQALIWSVMAMALPSFFIGVLPGAATIGIAAPILLLVCRLLQGLAVGGEYGASVRVPGRGRRARPARVDGKLGAGRHLRRHPARLRRGRDRQRLAVAGGRAGLGLASSVHRRGRRRAGCGRDPALLRGAGVARGPSRSPLGEAFRSYWRTILHQVALIAGLSVGFYTTFVYSATWLAQVAQVPARVALGINTLAMALSLAASLAAGRLSDRVGRRPVLLAWAGAQVLLSYPLMALMSRGETGRHRGRPGGAGPAGRRGQRRPARGRGRDGALAGALHRGRGGAQRGDGAPGRNHAAGRGLARRPDRRSRSRRRST